MYQKEVLQNVLLREKDNFYPVIESLASSDHLFVLDFSTGNTTLNNIDLKNTVAFNQYVFHEVLKGKIGVGGYLENRIIYKRSQHYQDLEPRSVHLGIDIWAAAGTTLFAPLAGKIHSFADNNGFGNYGPTIILEHSLDNITFYTLYGHLTAQSLLHIYPGKPVTGGEPFAAIGNFPENGDWPPHLHFQVITDLLGTTGDFPGVAAPSQLGHFKEICIDPNLILRIEVLF